MNIWKKKDSPGLTSSAHMPDIDTSSLTSVELVQQAIVEQNENYVRKAKLHDQIKQSKNDTNASYREQLKEIKEDMDEQMAQISALNDHLKLVSAATG